jgi:hypothetical protein
MYCTYIVLALVTNKGSPSPRLALRSSRHLAEEVDETGWRVLIRRVYTWDLELIVTNISARVATHTPYEGTYTVVNLLALRYFTSETWAAAMLAPV